MNKAILMGRLTKEPDIRYSRQGDRDMAIARYNLAIDRRGKDNGADFISCVAFDRNAEFAEKYLHKGTKICVVGSIRTGSYTNQAGNKCYTTDVIVNEHHFCESSQQKGKPQEPAQEGFGSFGGDEGFMHVPDSVEDSGLPFN